MESIATQEQLHALDQIAEMDSVATVDVAIFRDRYLPVLAGAVEGVSLALWLEVAKAPTAKVDVTENGKVIFTVPALIRTPTIIPTKSGRESMIEVIATTALKTEQHPRLGITYFREKSSARIQMDDVDMHALGQWNAILKRFGYETIGTTVGDVDTKRNAVEENPTISGYDEL